MGRLDSAWRATQMLPGVLREHDDRRMRKAPPGCHRVELNPALLRRPDDAEAIATHGFIRDDRRQDDEAATLGGHHFRQGKVRKLCHDTRLHADIPEPRLHRTAQRGVVWRQQRPRFVQGLGKPFFKATASLPDAQNDAADSPRG
jgi:hypothetical protein